MTEFGAKSLNASQNCLEDTILREAFDTMQYDTKSALKALVNFAGADPRLATATVLPWKPMKHMSFHPLHSAGLAAPSIAQQLIQAIAKSSAAYGSHALYKAISDADQWSKHVSIVCKQSHDAKSIPPHVLHQMVAFSMVVIAPALASAIAILATQAMDYETVNALLLSRTKANSEAFSKAT